MANLLWATFLIVLLQRGRSQSCGAGSTACKCTGTDPKTSKSVTFDISTLFPSYPTTVNGASGWNYIYNPCNTFTCGGSSPNQANVCQQSKTSTSTEYNAGATPEWTIVNSTSFTIRYSATTSGIVRTTTVTFIGVATLSQPQTTTAAETGTGKYAFTVYMPISGGGGGGGGGAVTGGGGDSGYVGFILISLIISALIAYFVVGAIIMYTLKGARGIEVIPNIGFWKDLPFLIKDGVLFMLSPCCGQKLQKFSYTKM
eukprot:Em0407g2a